MESHSIQFTCPKTWFTWPGTLRPSPLPDWDDNPQPVLQPHDVYPATGYPGACMYSQTSGSGGTAAPAIVADCLRSQWSTDAHPLTPLAVYLRPRLFSLSLASPGAPHSPLSSLSNNQQPGPHKGGRQTTAKDATISSTVTYPCWYAGWINHNCFQAILIHTSQV